MIEVSQLSVALGGESIFEEVNFQVSRGEIVVLTGPSGSGKSTLLRCLAGLQEAKSGEITLSGKPANRNGDSLLRPHERNVSLVFQDLGLWPTLSVESNVKLAAKTRKREDKSSLSLSDTLDRFQIGRFAKRKPSQLSAGEQQRVALARAAFAQPEILLLDEPFSALDVLLKKAFYERLRELSETELAILVVSHDPGDAVGLGADRILCLENARLCDDITTLDIETATPTSETLKTWLEIMK